MDCSYIDGVKIRTYDYQRGCWVYFTEKGVTQGKLYFYSAQDALMVLKEAVKQLQTILT